MLDNNTSNIYYVFSDNKKTLRSEKLDEVCMAFALKYGHNKIIQRMEKSLYDIEVLRSEWKDLDPKNIQIIYMQTSIGTILSDKSRDKIYDEVVNVQNQSKSVIELIEEFL